MDSEINAGVLDVHNNVCLTNYSLFIFQVEFDTRASRVDFFFKLQKKLYNKKIVYYAPRE